MLLRLNGGAVECPASRLRAFLPVGLKSLAANFKVKTNASRFFNGSVLKRSYEGCLENILSCKGHGRSNRSTSAKDAQLQSYLGNIID